MGKPNVNNEIESLPTKSDEGRIQIGDTKSSKSSPLGAVKGGWTSLIRGSSTLPELAGILPEVKRKRDARIQEEVELRHLKSPEDLPIDVVTLIDYMAIKDVCIHLMADYAMRYGMIDKGSLANGDVKLVSVLGQQFLAYTNSVRLDIQALHEGRTRPVKVDVVQAVRRYWEASEDDNETDGGEE